MGFILTVKSTTSTGAHLADGAGQNRGVGGGQSYTVGGVGGGDDGVFEVLGRVVISVVGFKVDVA